MQLRSRVAVAVVEASSCTYNGPPGLGTPMGRRPALKKKKKKKKRERERDVHIENCYSGFQYEHSHCLVSGTLSMLFIPMSDQ